MAKTKSLRLNIRLHGHGVVQNGDKSSEKSLTYRRDDVNGQKHDNVTYAKGNYYRKVEDGEESLTKVLKISGDGLRHAIHAESMGVYTPNVLRNTATRLAYYSHLDTIIRGWLHTDAGHRNGSAYTITSAEDKDAVLHMEFCASSAPKTEKEFKDDPSQASVFTRESTGDTSYKAQAIVDISKLRFISFSDVYGRRAIADDEAETFIRMFSKNIGSQVSAPAYYRRSGAAITIPERGVLLTDEQVHVLLRHLLRGIANIQIVKSATGFARTKSVDMCAITADVAPGHYAYESIYTEESGLEEAKIPTEFDNVWELADEATALAELQAVEADVQRYTQETRERAAARKAEEKDKKEKKDKKGGKNKPKDED